MSRLEIERIETSDKESIETINNKIDDVVGLINRKIKEQGDKYVPWTAINKGPSYFINRKRISINDNAKFRTVYEVSQLFNKGYNPGSRKVYFRDYPGSKDYVWCPKLKFDIDDCKNIPYDNELSEDGNYIYETSKIHNDEFLRKTINTKENRFVFAKYKDEIGMESYKFIGVYSLKGDLSKNIKKRAWKKEKIKSIDLSKYFK